MYRDLRIGVVVPCYRVAREIGGVVAAMPDIVDEIFVVDDGSPDDLRDVLRTISDPRVRTITHEVNRGVGAATVSGMMAAVESRCDVVVKCDGDGQMDPAEIPLLLAPLADRVAEHAKGSRFHHVRELRTMPRWRFVGNIGLTFLTKLASGYWNVLDPVNGFFATRAEILRRLPLHRLSPRYFFESDLLIRLNIVEARVADVPLPARYGGEQSSLSLSRALFDFPPRLLAGAIKRLFWRYLFYDVSAVAIFSFFGVLLFGFGAAFGSYQWIWHAMHGLGTPVGTVMIAAIPLIFGFQLLLQALVLDIEQTPRPGKSEENRFSHINDAEWVSSNGSPRLERESAR